MKKTILSIALGLGLVASQAQELPMPSPSATLEQRVGLTDFTVEYSRPGVKDREVFGELVPFDQVWRTGANKVTTLEISTPIMINGEKVDAGKYSLLTIPGEDQWIIILNENNEMWGTGGYDQEQDVLRVEVPVKKSEFTETFTVTFNDIRNESANLILRWAETEVEVPVEVRVKEQALANIDKAIEEATDENRWRVYRNAANYYYNNDMEMDKALKYMEKSLQGNSDSWYSHWLKAEILAETGKYEAAVRSAKMAMEKGSAEAEESGSEFSYEEMISEAMEEWKSKAS